MDAIMIDEHLENIDRRLTRLEQILPTLATKEELKVLATKDDLRAEHERSRLDTRILIEHQDSKLDLLAEHVLSLSAKRTKE